MARAFFPHITHDGGGEGSIIHRYSEGMVSRVAPFVCIYRVRLVSRSVRSIYEIIIELSRFLPCIAKYFDIRGQFTIVKNGFIAIGITRRW